MPLGNPKGGFAFSPEYQSSALPWVTSSIANPAPQEWDFNYVTRFISVSVPTTGTLSIGFSLNGINGSNKYTIPGPNQVTLELRVSKLWVKGESGAPNYTICAGLTTIPAGEMPVLSASFPDGTNWQGVG